MRIFVTTLYTGHPDRFTRMLKNFKKAADVISLVETTDTRESTAYEARVEALLDAVYVKAEVRHRIADAPTTEELLGLGIYNMTDFQHGDVCILCSDQEFINPDKIEEICNAVQDYGMVTLACVDPHGIGRLQARAFNRKALRDFEDSLKEIRLFNCTTIVSAAGEYVE